MPKCCEFTYTVQALYSVDLILENKCATRILNITLLESQLASANVGVETPVARTVHPAHNESIGLEYFAPLSYQLNLRFFTSSIQHVAFQLFCRIIFQSSVDLCHGVSLNLRTVTLRCLSGGLCCSLFLRTYCW